MLIVKGLQWTLLTYILQDNLYLRKFNFMWALKALIVYTWKWLLILPLLAKKYISWLCVSHYSSTCKNSAICTIIHLQIYMSMPMHARTLSLSLSLTLSYTNMYVTYINFWVEFPAKIWCYSTFYIWRYKCVFPPGWNVP